MKTGQNFSTVSEFEAYLLMYCSSISGKNVSERWNQVKNTFGYSIYQSVMQQFKKDNDLTCIDKIQEAVSFFNLDCRDLDCIQLKVKELLTRFGKLETSEQVTYSRLIRLLRSSSTLA